MAYGFKTYNVGLFSQNYLLLTITFDKLNGLFHYSFLYKKNKYVKISQQVLIKTSKALHEFVKTCMT